MNFSVGATFATANLEAQQFVGTPSDELNFALGFDYAVHPRVTISADAVGHNRLSGADEMTPQNRPVQFVRTLGGPVQNQNLSEFQIFGADQSQGVMRGIVGTKVNPWRNLLIVGNVLMAPHDYGLSHKPALSLGIEYTF
jgi:hypothetical protein